MTRSAPHPVDVRVGANIRLRRQMAGLSQEKLGEALGVTFQQVQKNEKGTNRVGASRLAQIASVLRCKVSDLFEGVDAVETTSEAPPVVTIPAEAIEVVRVIGLQAIAIIPVRYLPRQQSEQSPSPGAPVLQAAE